MNKIFISYSHDSREHADRVLALANRLRAEGVDCVLDQYEESPAEGWTRWMDQQIRSAEFVLMICSEIYGKRVNGEEEPGAGLGVKWEGKLIYQHIYQADSNNTRFIPVVFAQEQVRFIPTPLQDATYHMVSNDEGYEKLYRRLTHQPKTQKPELGKLRELPPRERKQDFFTAPELFTAKLPTTSGALFGREQELKILDEAWADPHTHILTLVAWGGVGKTALVNEWLNQIAGENYRGAERVYGWSFYSQGTREERQVSADEFLAHALNWFGDPDVTAGAPWEKGARLAALIRRQRTLLVLDGLEPLQYPPGPVHGRLKDQGVQALLKELAGDHAGLCIVSTRVPVADLAHKTRTSVQAVALENLSAEAGGKLLRFMGVQGTDAELRAAAAEFQGHALALSLLGSYLATVHAGEVRQRDLIPRLIDKEEQPGYHAFRVMESYEHWLAATPELDLLYLMGLFDRPAAKGAIDALLAPPVLAGLTANLQKLPFAKLQFVLRRLRDLRLLAEKDESRPDALDCHPLLREHFGEKLRQQNPAAWQAAHSRLYDYYKNLPAKELPDTLTEMEPLFAAVAHGCQAGRHQETLDEVFWKRIRRGNEQYSYHKLGAFGADLSALSNFFEVLWRQPASGLRDDAKAVVLNWAGFALRALGRLREAAQPMQAGMEASAQKEDWEGAAQDAGNLSELYLTLGEVSQAVASARQSVDFADRSGDDFMKEGMRTALADALHQAGELAEAQKFFREAEAMQQQRQPAYAYLYSLRGFRFCDLLLGQGQVQEVQKRARQTLEWAMQQSHASLLTLALDKLSLGRAFLLQARAETTDPSLRASAFDQAGDYLRQAVAGLREAGVQEYLSRGLFARAACYRSQNDFAPARADLAEAREISERGDMKLHLADYHLEACRLCLAEGAVAVGAYDYTPQQAPQHLETAAQMVEEMGYGRRRAEVAALREEIEKL